MQLIANLSDMIEEELEDAEKYIKCAMKHKDDHPALAVTFAKISAEEMGHVALLHDQVVAIIAEYRKEHGDPPERMQYIGQHGNDAQAAFYSYAKENGIDPSQVDNALNQAKQMMNQMTRR